MFKSLEGAANGAEKGEECHGSEQSEDRGVRGEKQGKVNFGGQEGDIGGARIHGGGNWRNERG